MADLRLVSTRNRQLKPLVEAALMNELRLMEAGIRRTEQRLLEFEQKYHLGTQDFIARYENDEMEETIELDEWIGEFRLLARLRVSRGVRLSLLWLLRGEGYFLPSRWD
jgi:hypothetical protein